MSVFIDRRCKSILEKQKINAIYERNFDTDDAAEEIGNIYVKLLYLKFLAKIKPVLKAFVLNFDWISLSISIILILTFQLCFAFLLIIFIQMLKIIVISKKINLGLKIEKKEKDSGAKLPKISITKAVELNRYNSEFTQGIIVKTRTRFWSVTYFFVSAFFLALYLSQLLHILFLKIKAEDLDIKNPTPEQLVQFDHDYNLAISVMFYLFWTGSFLDNTNEEKDHVDSSKKLFNASVGYLVLLTLLLIEAKTINWLVTSQKMKEEIVQFEERKKQLTERIQDENDLRQRLNLQRKSSTDSWAKLERDQVHATDAKLEEQAIKLKDFIRKTTKKPEVSLDRANSLSRQNIRAVTMTGSPKIQELIEEEEKEYSGNFRSIQRRSSKIDLKKRLIEALRTKVLQIQWKFDLKRAINFKYISYFKCCLGTFLQDATIGILLIAAIQKASFVSWIYMIFSLVYLVKKERVFEVSGYLVLFMIMFQLFLALINFSSFNSPMILPKLFYYDPPCPQNFYPGLVCENKIAERKIDCNYCSVEQQNHLHVFPIFLYSNFIQSIENLRWVLFFQLGVSKTKFHTVFLDLIAFAFYCIYYVNSFKQDQKRSITLRDENLLQKDQNVQASFISLDEKEKQEIMNLPLQSSQLARKEEWKVLNLKLYSIKDKSWLTQTYKGCKVALYLLFPVFCTISILMLGILTKSLIPLTYIVAGLFAIASSVNFFKEDPLSQQANDAFLRSQFKNSLRLETDSRKPARMKQQIDEESSQPLLSRRGMEDSKSNYMDMFFQRFEEKSTLNEYEKRYGKYQYKWYYRGIYRYFLIPLISIDLTLQVIYFVPVCYFHPRIYGCPDYGNPDPEPLTSWQEILGFQETSSWEITKDGEIQFKINQHIAFLLIRCLIFFFCILSLRIFDSDDFKKFCSKYVNMILKMSMKKSLQQAYHQNNKKIIKIVRIAKDKNVMDQKIQNLRAWLETWRDIYKRFNRDPYNKKCRKLLYDDLEKDQQTLEKEENPANFEINALFNDRVRDHKSITLTYTPDLSPEDKELLIKRLVKRKSKTLPCCARFYDFINRHWLNPIIFIIRKQLIEERLKESYQCKINKHSDIDDRLYKDITRYLDGFEIQEEKEKAIFLNKKEVKKYIEANGRDHKAQIVHLQDIPAKKTEKWTSCGAVCGRYSSFLPKLLATHSDHVAYFFMILSMMINAGLISLPFPFLVFGYAHMKENGPSKNFWNIVMWYTCFIIIFKVIAQQNLWIAFVGGQEKFDEITDTMKVIRVGVYYLKSDDLGARSAYFVPELFVLFAIFAHQAKEISIGLWKKKQGEIENIHEAADRVLTKRFSTFVFTDSLTDPDIPIRPRSRSIAVLYEATTEEQVELVTIAKGQERVEHVDVFSMPEKGTLNEYYKVILDRIKNRKTKKASVLVDNKFMRELFPKLREQKPGRDFYNMMAISQFLILIYIVLFFSQMEGQSTDFQEAISYSQFPGEMILYLIIQITIMTIDRFLLKGKNFRTTRLVGHYEIQDVYVQENGERKITKVDFGETAITFKVVAKFYLQIIVLLMTHILVFWLFPMYGDQIRTGNLYCKIEDTQPDKAPLVCNDFKYSPVTVIFYLINLLYFLFSAKQIKYGLTEYTGRGFLMKSYNRYLKWSLNWYYAIPFLFELRTSIDWMHSKTTLSVFGWLRVAYTKKKVFDTKVNRQNRANTPYGRLVKLPDKLMQGGLIFLIIMLSIVGPLIFFSTFNPIAVINNPNNAQVSANINIATLSNTANKYNLFWTDGSALVTKFSDADTKQAGFNSVIATSLYTDQQRIFIEMSPFSDNQWLISDPKKKELKDALKQVVDKVPGVTMDIEFVVSFTRELPLTQKVSTVTYKKPLGDVTPTADNPQPFEIAKNISDAINFDCSKKPTEDFNLQTKLDRFINPVLRLGSSATAVPITEDLNVSQNLTLIYNCNNFWELDGQLIIKNTKNDQNDGEIYSLPKWVRQGAKRGLQFFTFNDKVQSSYFPYTIVTFYTGVVLLIGTFLRNLLVHEPSKYPISQMPHPQKIIVLCETIMIYQMQGRYIDEEEAYAMLIEITRSTELLREISGRSIKDRPDGNKFAAILERGKEKED